MNVRKKRVGTQFAPPSVAHSRDKSSGSINSPLGKPHDSRFSFPTHPVPEQQHISLSVRRPRIGKFRNPGGQETHPGLQHPNPGQHNE